MTKRKLHSKRGATMLLALVILLVSTVVSTLLLTAATSAVRRVRDTKTQQQGWLTISSAEGLLRGGITADSRTTTLTSTIYPDDTTEDIEEETPCAGVFAPLLTAALSAADAGHSYQKTFRICAPEQRDVRVDFTMDTDRAIRAVLTLEDPALPYQMVLLLRPQRTDSLPVSTTLEDESIVTTSSSQVWWDFGGVQKGGVQP